MTFFLTYGDDGVGKTIQHVNLAVALPDSLYLSLEIKDEDLIVSSGIEAIPVLKIYPETYTINPFATLTTLESEINKILKGNYRNIIIDGISQLRKFSIEVTLAEENKDRVAKGQKAWERIPKEAYGIWEEAGRKVFEPLDRLSNWSHIKKANVFLTARIKENYVGGVKVGSILDFKEFIKFSVDVKVQLVRDGRGYFARFEKFPKWGVKGALEVPVDEMGLLVEFSKRGLLK